MTTFNSPLFLGPQDTGSPVTDPRLTMGGWKIVEVSAGGKTVTRNVPPNSSLVLLQAVVSGVPASVTQGITVRVGTTAAPTAYGVINGVTNGWFMGSINAGNFGAVGVDVVFDVTASVSAADFNAGQIQIRAQFVPVS